MFSLTSTKKKNTRLHSCLTNILNLYYATQPMQVQLSYSECTEAPVKMDDGVAIAISGKVYYGGGGCNSDDDECYTHCFNPSQDEWSTLPKLFVRYFGLGEVKGELVTVGGNEAELSVPSKTIHAYDETSKIWKQTIPPMPTARESPAVASLPTHLVVAGGWMSQGPTDIVEIYSSNINQWSKTNSLPYARNDPQIAFCNNTLYLIGGWDGDKRCSEAFIAQIDKLISNSIQTNQDDAGAAVNENSVWDEIANTPSYRPKMVTMYANALAVGGVNSADIDEYTPTQAIHAYSSSMNSWVYIGDLPSPIAYPATVSLSPTEFLLIGGEDKDRKRLSTVYKATIKIKV